MPELDKAVPAECSGPSPAQASRKIVFITPNSNEYGGLEKHLLQLIERLLPERGTQVSIICFGPDIFSGRFDPAWIPRVTVHPVREPETLAGWMKLFWKAQPDVVVFCYGWIASFPWQATVSAMLAGIRRRYAIQHLVPPPAPPPVEGRSFRDRLRRQIGRRARLLLSWKVSGYFCNKTICVSDGVRNALINEFGFPARRTITVQNGVSTTTFVPSKSEGAALRDRLRIGADEFLLVCAARLAEAKGIDILIQAVARIIGEGISCKCLIVGDGPLREKLSQQVESLGLSDCVFFEGFQTDVRPYLRAASAFVLTSHLEGLPLSVLEAMACGVPCIVTDVGGSAEAVQHQLVGLVIPRGSVEGAAAAMTYLATHPAERSEMASQARQLVCREFDIDTRMGELVGVLRS